MKQKSSLGRDLASLADLRRLARELLAMRERHAIDDVLASDELTSAVLHKIIILGEAANRVSPVGRQKWPLPWRDMIGMRNVVVHDYEDVDLDIVWKLGEAELPKLVAQIEAILAEFPP